MADLGERRVVVVGAGISGAACARALGRAGLHVRVLDRGRRVGGRMALREESLGGARRVVDIGASYFTVSDPAFAGWWRSGGSAAWPGRGPTRSPFSTGRGPRRRPRPARCAGPRPPAWALVEDLLAGFDVRSGVDVEQVDAGESGLAVDGEPAAAVVLAMPSRRPSTCCRRRSRSGWSSTPGRTGSPR